METGTYSIGPNKKERGKIKPYTVVGYWKDEWGDESVTIHVYAENPSEAAQIASFMVMDWADKEDKIKLFEIVQVFRGHLNGQLDEVTTVSADYIVRKFFKTHDYSVLPTYIGITPSLDKAIERKLKDKEMAHETR